jgi:hypothetical protein
MPRPVCPNEVEHRLVRNGTFSRGAQDGRGAYQLTIQRYRRRTSTQTFSVLPYDCRPFANYSWPLALAVGWVCREEHGWTWAQCQQWLTAHDVVVHPRTLARWAGPLAGRVMLEHGQTRPGYRGVSVFWGPLYRVPVES